MNTGMRLPARPEPIMSRQSRCSLRLQYRRMRKCGVPALTAKHIISNIELAISCDAIFLSCEQAREVAA